MRVPGARPEMVRACMTVTLDRGTHIAGADRPGMSLPGGPLRGTFGGCLGVEVVDRGSEVAQHEVALHAQFRGEVVIQGEVLGEDLEPAHRLRAGDVLIRPV